MTGKPDAAADWRGKIYDEATHQWIDAEPVPASADTPAADTPATPVRRGRPGASAETSGTAESLQSAPE